MITAYEIGKGEKIIVSELKWKPSIGDEIHTIDDGDFLVQRVIIFVGRMNNLGNQPQTVSVWCKKLRDKTR